MVVTTNLSCLMQKAQAVGKAKLRGNMEEIEKTKRELAAYEQIVLKSNKLSLNVPCRSL